MGNQNQTDMAGIDLVVRNLGVGAGTPGETYAGLSDTADTVVMMPGLPTSDPGVAGQLWSNTNVVTVSAG